MSRIGIVTGLPREARLLRGVPALVRCEGPGPIRARSAAAYLIAKGAHALISFGVAGGLDPGLGSGDVIVATEVIASDGTRYPADARGNGTKGPILSRDLPVAGVPEKRRLFAETGALAVDMESGAVAAAAAAAGLRFAAIRAISDPAGRALPPAALAALKADGSVDYLALLARPRDWGGLIALAGDFRRATRALRDVARLGGLVL